MDYYCFFTSSDDHAFTSISTLEGMESVDSIVFSKRIIRSKEWWEKLRNIIKVKGVRILKITASSTHIETLFDVVEEIWTNKKIVIDREYPNIRAVRYESESAINFNVFPNIEDLHMDSWSSFSKETIPSQIRSFSTKYLNENLLWKVPLSISTLVCGTFRVDNNEKFENFLRESNVEELIIGTLGTDEWEATFRSIGKHIKRTNIGIQFPYKFIINEETSIEAVDIKCSMMRMYPHLKSRLTLLQLVS